MAKKSIKPQLPADIKDVRLSTYMNGDVKEYAKYVIRTRAMPNIMDGLRVGARKILYAALTGDLSKRSKIKMPSLIGDAMKLHYNHSDTALMNTIVQLGSKHINKYNPLYIVGQIGTLRIPKCDTAPRYLHVKQNPSIDIFKVDKELWEIQTDDGDKIEPKFLLPIVPVVLLWRTNSPGYGFSFRSFSYNLDSIIDNCIQAISTGSCYANISTIPLKPEVLGIDPDSIIYNSNKGSWYSIGNYDLLFKEDVCTVNDLPYNITLENYTAHLDMLVDKAIIKSYTDLGIDGEIKFIIKFYYGGLERCYADKWQFYQTFKLFSKIPKNTMNVIDIDGKSMLFYDSELQLIDGFVKRRLLFYNKRKIKTIEVLEERLSVLNANLKFIKLIVENKLIINNRPISDIETDLTKHDLPFHVLKLKISKLTKNEIAELSEEISTLEERLIYIKNTPIETMYILDLIELKEKLSTIIKIQPNQ